jgi:hypothetical protein
MVNEDDMLGLIIITVVCCAVGTSIVWVVIIYQTRRRLNASQNASRQSTKINPTTLPELEAHLYLDTSSQHSKDSGTGDSTNPSNDQLQLCLPGIRTLIINFRMDTTFFLKLSKMHNVRALEEFVFIVEKVSSIWSKLLT